MTGGMGRLYIFRPIRSFGAHIDDYITVNGAPVHRVTPGTGFYCDVSPGDYVIGVAHHKAYPLKVSVAAGQHRYVCVMLHHVGGVAPRGGRLLPISHSMFVCSNPSMGHSACRNIL